MTTRDCSPTFLAPSAEKAKMNLHLTNPHGRSRNVEMQFFFKERWRLRIITIILVIHGVFFSFCTFVLALRSVSVSYTLFATAVREQNF